MNNTTTCATLDQELVYRSDDYQNYTILWASQPKENEKNKLRKSTYHDDGRKRTFSTPNPNFGRPYPRRNCQTRKENEQSSEHVYRLCLNRRDHSVARWRDYVYTVGDTEECCSPVLVFARRFMNTDINRVVVEVRERKS